MTTHNGLLMATIRRCVAICRQQGSLQDKNASEYREMFNKDKALLVDLAQDEKSASLLVFITLMILETGN